VIDARGGLLAGRRSRRRRRRRRRRRNMTRWIEVEI
jgi:hypothetical protein